MHKFIDNVLFGMGFGCGFIIAYGFLRLIASLISGGRLPW